MNSGQFTSTVTAFPDHNGRRVANLDPVRHSVVLPEDSKELLCHRVFNIHMDNSQRARRATQGEADPKVRRAKARNFDSRMVILFVYGLLLATWAAHQGHAQEVLQAQPAMFLRANDRFGFELLRATHEDSPDRNIVLSPLPVSLAFAVLWDGGMDNDSAAEVRKACHCFDPDVPSAAKMILRRFEKPKPLPFSTKAAVGMPPAIGRMLLSGKPEEMWLSAAFLYRTGTLSPDFVNRATEDIGVLFRVVGEKTSQSAALATSWDPTAPMPKITGRREFWFTSSTHLRTSWQGNTFVDSRREKRKFHLQSTPDVSVDFLTTEPFGYLYARTDQFEAVKLPCRLGTILLVLPPANTGIEQMEAIMASQPDLVESKLTLALGNVTLPPFHFLFDAELRNPIEKLGVHRLFADLQSLAPMAPDGGILRGVAQKTEITLDENGVRADSGTIFSGVVGGMMTVTEPFHMILDRPFLFFVRDNVTKALIFAGAVVNPALH